MELALPGPSRMEIVGRGLHLAEDVRQAKDDGRHISKYLGQIPKMQKSLSCQDETGVSSYLSTCTPKFDKQQLGIHTRGICCLKMTSFFFLFPSQVYTIAIPTSLSFILWYKETNKSTLIAQQMIQNERTLARTDCLTVDSAAQIRSTNHAQRSTWFFKNFTFLTSVELLVQLLQHKNKVVNQTLLQQMCTYPK